jgi:hypothetical protein
VKQLKEETAERQRKKLKRVNESTQDHEEHSFETEVCCSRFCVVFALQYANKPMSVEMQDSSVTLVVLLNSTKGLRKVPNGAFMTTLKKELVCCSCQWHGLRYIAMVEKTAVPSYKQFTVMFHHCKINLKIWMTSKLPAWLSNDEELKVVICKLLDAK